MSDLLQAASLACAALGLLSAAAVLARARDLRLAVAVLLSFLLAAGLLRLSTDASWTALATAAALVVVRRLLVVGLGRNPTGG